MRIALVVHGFPPFERTGVETHVAALARNLARRGLSIEVFAPRADPMLPDFAQRREERDGYGLTWVISNRVPQSAAEHLDPPGMAAAFSEFLDRTRPALVHFHHVQKLGIGAIEATARRGLPAIYTAHDYFPVCHRTILARPDLSRCSTLGDSCACARCDLAVSYLNGRGRWSDFQAGVLPDSLSEDERRELAQRLDPAAGQTIQTAAFEERARLDRLRKSAFDKIDLFFAPTDFLREQLIAGGFDPTRVERSDYGIETAALRVLPPPRGASIGPLTFGYIGGAHKHKGLHVLLEAFAGLHSTARLSIHADSTDLEYVAELRERARALGADWHGAFAAEDLPRILAGIDVLVVPSIWWENAPFVIREAFAASRPVIASDLPALRESVRDGVDGLLVAPGDVGALKDALQRLIAQPKLLASLSRKAQTPRSLDDLAGELHARYSELIAKKTRRAPAEVPRSARPFAERVLALESLGVAELAQRATEALPLLARSLGVDVGAAAIPDARSIALEHLHDARREIAWRIERGAALDANLEHLRAAKQESDKGRIDLGLELMRSMSDGKRASAALLRAEKELASRAREIDAAALAQAAAREALEREQSAHAEARAALAKASSALADLLSERGQLDEQRRELEQALTASREANESLSHSKAEIEEHLRQAERHARWLETEAANFARRFGQEADALRDDKDVRATHAVLARIGHELEWRRNEMRALRDDGGRIIRALIERSSLGRRMRGWEREP